MSLVEETITLKKSLTNNNNNVNHADNITPYSGNNEFDDEEIIFNENNKDNNDIRTIKEENETSQLLTERELNKMTQTGNVVNNNITLNTLTNYNIEALIEENKNLKKKLEEKIINETDNINNNINTNSNNVEIYCKQINELKKIIIEKEKELEEVKNLCTKNQKDELNNIIQNNNKNLEQLKNIYQLLIDGKDNRIKELEEEIISYDKEIEMLKEENNHLKNECRKDKILSEAEVNNLKNQKIELQCLLEQGGGSSNTLLNMNNITYTDNNSDKEKIIKLENEIQIKNKQILLLTQNHENDLKELNLAIEMLKQKISQLEEENICLSARNKKENN